jgi:hypothetical protein
MADYRAQRLARILADYERFTAHSNPMTDNNLIPPPELVQQWVAEIWHEGTPVRVSLSDEHIATRAAQWASDQELEACCEWLDGVGDLTLQLRAARRPKPPSLKEQALLQLDTLNADLAMHGMGCDLSQIRRAIEELPDD